MKRFSKDVVKKREQIARWIKQILKKEGFCTDCVCWEGTSLAIRLRILPEDSLGVVLFPMSVCQLDRKEVHLAFRSEVQTVIANMEYANEAILPLEYDYTEF